MKATDPISSSQNDKPPTSITNILVSVLIGIVLVAIVVLCIVFWKDISTVFSSKESVQGWLAGMGPWAPLAFIGLQFLQVVLFFIPGEIPQLAGGYFFGIWEGLLYSVIGIGLGSAFAFVAARILGIRFVTRLFGEKQIKKFETFISTPKAIVAFFLLFLIPGVPKDVLCYLAGLSYLGFGAFLGLSMLARLPALFGSILIGNAAANQQWGLVIVVGAVAVVLFGLGIIFRTPLHNWIVSIVHKPAEASPPENTKND